MNRRSFLSAIISLASAGVLLTSHQVVAADTFPASDDSMRKFVTVLSKGRAVIACKQELQQSDSKLIDTGALTSEFNELCRFLHENFSTLPPPAHVREMLTDTSVGSAFDFDSEEHAFAVAEDMVPLAVLRELLHHHHVEVPLKLAPDFRIVLRRYAGVVGNGYVLNATT